MILIVTHKTDFTADYVIVRLNELGIPYYRMNCEDILERDFSITVGSGLNYSINGNMDFKSVWFRRIKLPDFKDQSFDTKIYLQNELDCFFSNLFSILPVKWLSKPENVYNAENKVLQLKQALSVGFNVPETIITNNKEQIKNFFYNHDENIIIKPLHNNKVIADGKFGIIYTSKVTREYIAKINDYLITPSIIQREIEKQYELRVTVVNNEVFPAVVYSQTDSETKLDWRKKRLKFSSYSLPKQIEDKCIDLLYALGISFGAIDLIKSTDGNYYFLEINPNGQWAWIENDTELGISKSIINYLHS